MKSVNKRYVFGFLLISLIGVGLIIFGFVYNSLHSKSDYVETQGYVVSVDVRLGEHGMEYRPAFLRYYVEEEGKYYETTVFTWFNRPIYQGDEISVWYKKGNPRETIVSNASQESISLILIVIGGVLVVAGIVLTAKYLIDVNRKKI